MRSLEHDPLVHCNSLLLPIPLHRDVTSEEEQREGRDHAGVVQEYRCALDFSVVDEEFGLECCLIRVH